MAIIATTVIPEGTAKEAEEWQARIAGVLAASPGFILHTDGPAPQGGWELVSIWDSEADLTRYIDSAVRPYLPPDAPVQATDIREVRVIRPSA
jgi:hypothetical protein